MIAVTGLWYRDRMTDAPLPPADELAVIRAEAARLAGEAGALLLDTFAGPLDVRYKDEHERDPVTAADAAAEALLRDGILARFPNHAVLSEEDDGIAGDASSPYLWVLDPLDGTANFMNGLALFAVSVGVLHERRPVAGAIFAPAVIAGAPAVLSAAAGMGATFGDAPIDRQARVALKLRLGALPGGGGRRRGRGAMPEGLRLGEPRSLGSIALEMALVATGGLQYAVFGRPRLWDVAAGAVIVAEAGGAALGWGQHGWSPVERFEPDARIADPLEGLRKWSRPLVAGDEAAARYLAGAMPGPPGTVRRMLWRLRR